MDTETFDTNLARPLQELRRYVQTLHPDPTRELNGVSQRLLANAESDIKVVADWLRTPRF